MQCKCGRPVFAKRKCKGCYQRAWMKKNPARRQEYCQRQMAAFGPQVKAMDGIETLEALTMAFNVDELSLARYILEQRDRSGARMTFA